MAEGEPALLVDAPVLVGLLTAMLEEAAGGGCAGGESSGQGAIVAGGSLFRLSRPDPLQRERPYPEEAHSSQNSAVSTLPQLEVSQVAELSAHNKHIFLRFWSIFTPARYTVPSAWAYCLVRKLPMGK